MDANQPSSSRSGAARGRDVLSMLNSKEGLMIALLESAAQAIVSADRKGKIVLANRKTEECFGFKRAELLGAPIERCSGRKTGPAVRQRTDYFDRPRVRPMGIGWNSRGGARMGASFL